LDLGITQSEQLGQFVPGLEIQTPNGEGSQLTVFLRGAGLQDFNTNNSGPIGIYADEVYLSSPGLTTFDIFDLDRVEVLKGPQGTLYGRNTTGGAIKFISNTPTEQLSGHAKVRLENFGGTSLEGAISGSIAENVHGRFAVSKNDSDGYGTNLLDNSDTNGIDTLAYRGFLDVEFKNNLTLRLNVHGGENNSQTAATSPLGLTSDGSTPCPPAIVATGQCVNVFGYRSPDDVFTGSYNNLPDTSLKANGGYVELDWVGENIEFTSITAYDKLDRTLFEETDGSPNSLVEITFGIESETISQELRLTGKIDRLTWLAGAFYLTEDLDQNQTIDLFRDLRPLIGGGSDPLGQLTGAPILFARSLNSQKIDTFALFGQATYDLSNALSLTLGARFTDEDREFSALGNPFPVYSDPDLTTSASETSWRVALDYTLSEDVLSYMSAARGFKSGGFNGGFLSLNQEESSRQLQPYDAEFVTAYELGIKSELAEGKVRVNAALFYNDFEDLQVFTQINTGTTPLLVLDNAASAEAYGAELEVIATPASGWTIGVNVALTESELINPVENSASGNEIANTPKTAATAIVRYDHQLANGNALNAQIATSYRSETATNTGAGLSSFLGSTEYTLTNARIGYEMGNWSFAAFINNLSNEEYITSLTVLSDFSFAQRFYGEPRTYGVEVMYDF